MSSIRTPDHERPFRATKLPLIVKHTKDISIKGQQISCKWKLKLGEHNFVFLLSFTSYLFNFYIHPKKNQSDSSLKYAKSQCRLPLVTRYCLVVMVVAVLEGPIVVEVKVPAHSVILAICFQVISGEFGVVSCPILFAIALATATSITAFAVEIERRRPAAGARLRPA